MRHRFLLGCLLLAAAGPALAGQHGIPHERHETSLIERTGACTGIGCPTEVRNGHPVWPKSLKGRAHKRHESTAAKIRRLGLCTGICSIDALHPAKPVPFRHRKPQYLPRAMGPRDAEPALRI